MCAQAEPLELAEFTISVQVVWYLFSTEFYAALHKLQPAWDASGCE